MKSKYCFGNLTKLFGFLRPMLRTIRKPSPTTAFNSTMGRLAKILFRKTSATTIVEKTDHLLWGPLWTSCGRTGKSTAAISAVKYNTRCTSYVSVMETTLSSLPKGRNFTTQTTTFPTKLESNWASNCQFQHKTATGNT